MNEITFNGQDRNETVDLFFNYIRTYLFPCYKLHVFIIYEAECDVRVHS